MLTANVKEHAVVVETNVNKVATNHVEHIQASGADTVAKLNALDEKGNNPLELLASIDKNISILVDRGR